MESGEESELLGDFRDSTHRKMGKSENSKKQGEVKSKNNNSKVKRGVVVLPTLVTTGEVNKSSRVFINKY